MRVSDGGPLAPFSSVPVGSVSARDLALRCGSLTDAESAWCSEAGWSATSIRTDLSLLSLLLQPKVHTNVALSRNMPLSQALQGVLL